MPTGEATLEQDADGSRWLVVTMATPRPVDGLQQVWLLKRDATDMVSVGLMAGVAGSACWCPMRWT